MQAFLYLTAAAGAIVPWGFFAAYFSQNGFSPSGMAGALFVNPLAGGFAADIFISIFVFLVWTFFDLRDRPKKWLLILLCCCFVGLSLALPVYLLMKLHQAAPKPQQRAHY